MIRKAFLALAIVALLGPAWTPATSAKEKHGSWRGWISDSHCGAKGAREDHVSCARRCVKVGSTYVFYNPDNKKIYTLDAQEVAAEHLGHEVVLTGTREGTTITVEAIVEAD